MNENKNKKNNMTQEEKQLLLKDLSARLPFGVMCHINGEDAPRKLSRIEVDELDGILLDFWTDREDYLSIQIYSIQVYISEVKPYLRSMPSMTKEELHEVQEILGKGVEICDGFISIVDSSINTFSYLELQAVFDWFNARHFDYHGLIEKGLAIEVTENNNPYK